MKLRNQLLALFCLLLFIAFGFLYFHKWVEHKPFGIIIFVGGGLTTGNITAARLYNGGSESRLNLENSGSFPNVAILSNYANDYAVPDSAAAASTIATGEKVNKGSISTDSKGKAIESILELAREKGRSTGLVTNGNLTDPGAAAFYAHATNATNAEDLARQFADNAKITVVMGGGASAFMPESKGGLRKDGRDLILELGQKNRQVVRSKAELENVAPFLTSNPSLVGIFSNDALAYSDKIEAGSQQPALKDMVQRAIELLQYNTSGYVLVVDCELAGRAAGQNDGEHAIRELIAMDDALHAAQTYAGKNALIIMAGKNATGGMSLNGYPLRQVRGVGLLGTDSLGTPSITWATGPNGPVVTTGSSAPPPGGTPSVSSINVNMKDQPAAFHSDQAINNADDVIAVGTGQGSQALKGFLDNTVIFKLIKDNL